MIRAELGLSFAQLASPTAPGGKTFYGPQIDIYGPVDESSKFPNLTHVAEQLHLRAEQNGHEKRKESDNNEKQILQEH